MKRVQETKNWLAKEYIKSHLQVKRIAELVVKEMELIDVQFKFTGGTRGWTGDIPKMLLDISKIKSLGWQSKFNSESAVDQAIKDYLSSQ